MINESENFDKSSPRKYARKADWITLDCYNDFINVFKTYLEKKIMSTCQRGKKQTKKRPQGGDIFSNSWKRQKMRNLAPILQSSSSESTHLYLNKFSRPSPPQGDSWKMETYSPRAMRDGCTLWPIPAFRKFVFVKMRQKVFAYHKRVWWW